jgi:two-component system OmpR family sensor kinase
LTFAILCAFALVVGFLTAGRMRSDFAREVAQDAQQVEIEMHVNVRPETGQYESIEPPLPVLAGPSDAVIRLYSEGGNPFAQYPARAPKLTPVPLTLRPGLEVATTAEGYDIVTIAAFVRNPTTDIGYGRIFIQYARPLAQVNAAIARVELFLFFGVLAGTALALLAGTLIARRAMAPIAALTSTAAKIARTRDRSLAMPEVPASDEVGELARTLSGMLRELDAAHADTEAMLARQRRFVADASHELRTPLTSVLANLELLAERADAGALEEDLGEAARSALRSSRRMRRLVADLLLLARNDVPRTLPQERIDLAQIAVDAAAELGPISEAHEVSLDVAPAPVAGSRDELERVAINLIENALRYTPPGSQIWVRTATAGKEATLIVEDNGPGVAEDLAASLFERFVRGAGDRGGSFGLGLAIVRAVVSAHGGSVSVERASGRPSAANGGRGGARFIVRLPLLGSRDSRDRADRNGGRSDLDHDRQNHRSAPQAIVDEAS